VYPYINVVMMATNQAGGFEDPGGGRILVGSGWSPKTRCLRIVMAENKVRKTWTKSVCGSSCPVCNRQLWMQTGRQGQTQKEV
jgi:hypothetical protein